MHPHRSPPIVLIIAAIAFGCSQGEPPTAVAAPDAQARHAIASSHDEPHGALIVRSANRFLLIALDFEKQLLASHGWTDGFPGMCGDPITVVHLNDLQLLFNPAEQELVMQLLRADQTFVRVHDWTGQPPIESTLCEGTVLYHGVGRVLRTDNDLLPGGENADHPRTNAFGFTAQGTLTDAWGGQVHYNAIQRFILDIADDGSTSRFREIRTIDVRPHGGN
jgi:hypothetical protein